MLTEPSLMTLEQWADLPEDEPGELVDSVLEEEEIPSFLHELTVAWLVGVLRNWVRPRGGWVFGSEAKYAVAPQRGRKPDVAVFFAGMPTPKLLDSLARTPPSIAIEVLTPRPRDARRDRIEKLADYARFGVPYYWIIDPSARTLEVFERAVDGRYTLALAAGDGEHDVPGCTELMLNLNDLWGELDAWEHNEGEHSDVPKK